MSLDPFELCISSTQLPILRPSEDRLDQVFILDVFAGRGLPVVLFPPWVPFGKALDGVVGVSVYTNRAVDRDMVQGSSDGG